MHSDRFLLFSVKSLARRNSRMCENVGEKNNFFLSAHVSDVIEFIFVFFIRLLSKNKKNAQFSVM